MFMLKLLGPEGRKQLREAGPAGTLGIEMGLAVALGYLGGSWLDGRFGSAPWLTYLGLALGLAAAFKSLYLTVQEHRAREARTDDSPHA